MTAEDLPPLSDADAPDDDGLGGRALPFDLLAEQSVLGGMMLATGEVIDDVIDVLNPSDFHLYKHEEIALAIVGLHRAGKPCDVIAVTDELQRLGALTRIGGPEYLHTLTGIVPTSANAGYYAEIVAAKATMRRLVEAGVAITNKGYASEGTPEELVEDARAIVDDLAGRRKLTVTRVGETFDRMLDELTESPTYIPTPWSSLDKVIGGFAPGNLCVFAARPGGGKSIALLQVATRIARVGAVAVSSLEMTETELQQRLLAQFGGIQMGTIRSRSLTEVDWNSAREARTKLLDAPIFIDGASKATIAHIRAHARGVLRRHGNLGAIVVDYLQLVPTERREGRERHELVTETAEALKAMAKEFNVPVIAAAQLKRAGASRSKTKPAPTLEDLRESGGIENTADVVVLQHRPSEEKAEIELIVAKNRHGSQGKATLRWQGEYARLLDRAWSPTPHIDDTEEAP